MYVYYNNGTYNGNDNHGEDVALSWFYIGEEDHEPETVLEKPSDTHWDQH